uniref:Uncharacterized protein n=1 Tax=Physcomitrium patens TaxID=3218 RepID=A0A2K1JY58_PHYPA|nr:hypothetical protein PHYPA_013581 [Physcomitrium patens]
MKQPFQQLRQLDYGTWGSDQSMPEINCQHMSLLVGPFQSKVSDDGSWPSFEAVSFHCSSAERQMKFPCKCLTLRVSFVVIALI